MNELAGPSFGLLRCRVCKALWRSFPAGAIPGVGASLSLWPGDQCGPCCDNVRGDLEDLVATPPAPAAMPATVPAPAPVNRDATTLTDGSPVTPDHREINPATGMQKGYVVLSAEERAKGFVRPVRRSYRHVGRRPRFPLRDLTDKEREIHGSEFAKFEDYPASERPGLGRFWTSEELTSGCGTVTTMGLSLAETYARDPKFYGGTFCAGCHKHFPVGADGEFVWDGTDERVGT